MLQTLKNAWNTKDIRSKILFTLLIVLLYRVGTVIPVPFVDSNNVSGVFSGTVLDLMNYFSGGALGTATLFALGVSPYINASIIIQLLAVVFPNSLGRWAKEDKEKMNIFTRIVTVVLAIVTAIGYYFLLAQNNLLTDAATQGQNDLFWLHAIVIVTCYVAGASIIMWLAEKINDKGIGNGISIILFANIISGLFSTGYNLVMLVVNTFSYEVPLTWLYIVLTILFVLAFIALVFAMTVFVIWVTGSERRIPVQYAKKVVGRKMYGGQKNFLPIKVNMVGVMPVIFASSIVSLLPTILTFCGVTGKGTSFWDGCYNVFATDGIVYPLSMLVLIVAFAYFYTTISFDPVEVSNNLKRQGGQIPGIRQGRPTADFIKKILSKITLIGAIFLGIVAVLPMVLGPHVIQHLIEAILSGSPDAQLMYDQEYLNYLSSLYAQLGLTGSNYTVEAIKQNIQASIVSTAQSYASIFTFGGTSLLIVVGVVIETFRELEAELSMRNFKGFLN